MVYSAEMKKWGLLIVLWLPVGVWMGVLFYLSSISNLRAVENVWLDEVIRTISHFCFYGLGYLLFFRALNFGKTKKNFLLPLFLTWGYGFSDEVHQIFVPTRTFQLMDLAVDFGGAFVGKVLLRKILSKVK